MNRLKVFLFLITACLSVFCSGQQLSNQTLLTIDGNQYDAGTFMRVYLKNLDIVQDESQKDLDNYLQLYIDYRLKLLQAHEMGLQNKESYQTELKSYRDGLAESYLTDNEVTEALVKEAYERMNTEVNASHILIKIDRSAVPADTLVAYNRIKELKSRIENGEDFAAVARNQSEGPSAKTNGELGWFGPFKMVFEFETAAYETETGEVSDVFRTDFGYHILKVNDRRKTPEDVEAAHIMTYDQRQDSTINAKQRIDEIYSQLESGKDFESMAVEFSEDINTAKNGGKLPRFGTGGLNAPDFEEAAFNLTEIGSYSEPVKTKFGWHIIKLLKKYPISTFEEAETGLRDQIKKSARSRKITESFTNKLFDKYNVKLPKIASYEKRFPAVTDSLMSGNWKNEMVMSKSIPLFSIEDKTYGEKEFYSFIEEKQVKDYRKFGSLEEKLNVYFKDFADESVIDYYDENLERDNEDFAFIYREYKEGLLLFELMENKIWEAAKTDSLGQQAYYEKNKDKYQWKRRIDIDLTQNTTEETAQKVKQLLEAKTAVDKIKEQLNEQGNTKVMISSGIVEEEYSRLPKGFEVKKGVSKVYEKGESGFYKVVNVKDVLEPTAKTFEEARGSVINDYQQQLEKEWMETLREGRNINVNDKVLDKVKKEIEEKTRA
ncbi:peptidyl-prolyl cis-trans isomerase SurA [Nonlabens sp. Hel1_33_55]|uniref:peptidylprolyl isomerase n=1 Tax=Nonlabens sp. Hel1_33_55 TaxID=1336802 RepID=UPI000875DC27|nr:peptidylprolyl isomerase [Nonlabens sp. Hel1_33_55]SCY20609.1 peptidyl-prolyl cis-trans isomerase SurA [Nonlabens sp. Hel1_33_55]